MKDSDTKHIENRMDANCGEDLNIGDLVRIDPYSRDSDVDGYYGCRGVGFIVDIVRIGFITRWATVLIDGAMHDIVPFRLGVLSRAPENGA